MSSAEQAPRPEWMDDDLLKTCVLNSKNLPKDTDLQIDDVFISYAVPKGENYLSIIYRVKVDSHIIAKNGHKNGVVNGSGSTPTSLIVKIVYVVPEFKDIKQENTIFQKEIDMYMSLIPKLNQNLEAAGVEPIRACRCLYSQMSDPVMIVLEDLNVLGYVGTNRVKGLDLQQSKLALEQLAKIHSSSMQYITQNELPPIYDKSPFEPRKDIPGFEELKKTFQDGMHKRIDEIIKDLSPDPKYEGAIKFFKWYDQFDIEVAQQIWKKVPGNKFNGVLHGDCWSNNILFKYGENNVVESALLLDYQLSFISSVLSDFIYFFFSSVNNDTKRSHFETLKNFYLDCLVSNLTKLGYTGDIPTAEDFDAEIIRLRLLVAYILTTFNALVLAEMSDKQKDRSETEAFSLNDMLEITGAQGQAKPFQAALLACVDVLVNVEGFFDV